MIRWGIFDLFLHHQYMSYNICLLWKVKKFFKKFSDAFVTFESVNKFKNHFWPNYALSESVAQHRLTSIQFVLFNVFVVQLIVSFWLCSSDCVLLLSPYRCFVVCLIFLLNYIQMDYSMDCLKVRILYNFSST